MDALFDRRARRRRRSAAEAQQAAEQDACVYGAQVLDEAREELNRADAKAQVLLGTVGVGLGAVIGGLLAGSWSPFGLANVIEWLWWMGVGAAIAAVVALAGAVYPRLDNDRRAVPYGVMYFADALRYDSAEAVSAALMRSSVLDLARIAHQLHQVSRIVGLKYRLVQWGFWLALGAIAATVTSILVNLALS